MGDRTPPGHAMSLIPIITTTLSTPGILRASRSNHGSAFDAHAIFEQLCAGYSRIQNTDRCAPCFDESGREKVRPPAISVDG